MDTLEKFVRSLFLACVLGYFPVCMVGFLFRSPWFHIFSLWALGVSVVLNAIYDSVKYVLSKFRARRAEQAEP